MGVVRGWWPLAMFGSPDGVTGDIANGAGVD